MQSKVRFLALVHNDHYCRFYLKRWQSILERGWAKLVWMSTAFISKCETIMIAVAERSGDPQVLKQIPNEPGRVLKELRKLKKGCELKVCYEAGPLGFG